MMEYTHVDAWGINPTTVLNETIGAYAKEGWGLLSVHVGTDIGDPNENDRRVSFIFHRRKEEDITF